MVETENIVVQTAERIFADLADAQTINRDKQGGWKAPLWQALSEAGLPLSWVAEDHGGSGASLAEGFAVLGAAGRHAVGVPLAETMLAGWLLSQAAITSPEGEMTVAPAGPKEAAPAPGATALEEQRAAKAELAEIPNAAPMPAAHRETDRASGPILQANGLTKRYGGLVANS